MTKLMNVIIGVRIKDQHTPYSAAIVKTCKTCEERIWVNVRLLKNLQESGFDPDEMRYLCMDCAEAERDKPEEPLYP